MLIKENVKVKDNVSLEEIIEMSEFVANSCFVDGEYRPYYKRIAMTVAVFKYFIDGVKVLPDGYYDENSVDYKKEETSPLFCYQEIQNDDEIIGMIADVIEKNRACIMAQSYISEIVEFKKNKLAHECEELKEMSLKVCKLIDDITDILNGLPEIMKGIKSISDDDIDNARRLFDAIGKGDITENKLNKAIANSIRVPNTKIYNAQREELERLRNENSKLRKENSQLMHDNALSKEESNVENNDESKDDSEVSEWKKQYEMFMRNGTTKE